MAPGLKILATGLTAATLLTGCSSKQMQAEAPPNNLAAPVRCPAQLPNQLQAQLPGIGCLLISKVKPQGTVWELVAPNGPPKTLLSDPTGMILGKGPQKIWPSKDGRHLAVEFSQYSAEGMWRSLEIIDIQPLATNGRYFVRVYFPYRAAAIDVKGWSPEGLFISTDKKLKIRPNYNPRETTTFIDPLSDPKSKGGYLLTLGKKPQLLDAYLANRTVAANNLQPSN